MATPPLARPIGRDHVETTAPSPQQLPSLSDDLLLEIFLRVRCPADLTRASAACVAFRRLITDPTFPHRYRSLHPPLILGFVNKEIPLWGGEQPLRPVKAPHPNAPAARAVADKISFEFLPPPKADRRWYTADARDGRVLLECRAYWSALSDIAVCDPLFRQYLMLPPIPNYKEERRLLNVHAVFAPCADKNDKSFRVICMMIYYRELVIFTLDSGCDTWTLGTCSTWDALSLHDGESICRDTACCVFGCFYWKVAGRNRLLKLDLTRMELSVVLLPQYHGHGQELLPFAVVEAGEGMLGLLMYVRSCKALQYYHYNAQIAAGGEWQMKDMIPLPDHEKIRSLDALEGRVIVQMEQELRGSVSRMSHFYSLDVKTRKVESVSMMRDYFQGQPYFGYPPPMSPRLL